MNSTMNEEITTMFRLDRAAMHPDWQNRETDFSGPSNRAAWTGRILSGFAAAFLAFDASMKLFMLPPAVEATNQLGYPTSSMLPIGIVELICLALYLIPRTAIIGAILWTGYLGGAVATHVRVGSPLFSHTLFPLYVAALLWAGLRLRDRRVAALIDKSSPLLRLASVLFVVSAVGAAASLTEADKREGLAQLDRTRAGVVEATQGLSEAQWNFKPGPDRWSVAETLEHIVVVEEFLLDNVSQNVMKAPAGRTDRDNASIDRLVLRAIADRTQKAQAPEPVVPKGRWPPREASARFLKIRERTTEFLKSTPGLREHVTDSPLGQPLDAYQWLLYISAHSERHTKQILEVKADSKFPKN